MAMEQSGDTGARESDDPVDNLVAIGSVLELVADRVRAKRLLLVTDSPRVVAEIVPNTPMPIVLATTKEDLGADYAAECESVLHLSSAVPTSLDVLEETRSILVSAYLEGSLDDGEDVLCIVATERQPMLLFNLSLSADPTFRLVREGIESRCELPVFETLLRVAGDLVRQGREGKAVGTLFIIGDVKAVRAASRQVVINPFRGHSAEERSVLRPENIETIKEYALLDGAMLVTEDGQLDAAGRYVLLEADANLGPGLGGRHLAAASITQKTRAVAIVVSQSGVVRVYLDGKSVLELDGL